MKRIIKHAFIPNRDNDYHPHLLRGYIVFILSAVIVVALPLAALLHTKVVRRSDFFAMIVPHVLVEITNAERASNDLPPLTINPLLELAAQKKAEDMAANQYFSHTSPAGVTPWHWIQLMGYGYSYAGENLAIDFSDSIDVTNAWLASSEHRANMLNEHFSDIGIYAIPLQMNGKETIAVVQMFGSPKNIIPQTISSPPAAVKEFTPPFSEEELKDEAPIEKPISEETVAGAQNKSVVNKDKSIAADKVSPPKFIGRVIAEPKRSFTAVYSIFAALISLTMIMVLTIEFKRKHLRHLFYGFSLLLLIAISYVWTQSYIFETVVIL